MSPPAKGTYGGGAKCQFDNDCNSRQCGLNGEKFCASRGQYTAPGLPCLRDRDCCSNSCKVNFDAGVPLPVPQCS
ncbi:uncharacterized protein ASPGLDRAFT_44556 [Aspergillus glaucus CBS 516.65]|uniref:Uncharacterized protein n=1 Tax=Aspergillus glaucus CBS 516.65 TaxID=1160497 RepID=A0A1L9VS13_ASPGL|nr:hypothetical protein ASPGLDRAFT_44556 [Aspergillus glaucus CBS 516.65]OJJ86708.1 hypothetical protein ASPGLDRAFT_44556 [Aspergillus glaucus CBS 516.65]